MTFEEFVPPIVKSSNIRFLFSLQVEKLGCEETSYIGHLELDEVKDYLQLLLERYSITVTVLISAIDNNFVISQFTTSDIAAEDILNIDSWEEVDAFVQIKIFANTLI